MINRIEVKVLVMLVLIFLAVALYGGARLVSETVKEVETEENPGPVAVEHKAIPVTIGNKQFILEIANTPELRETGLSGRTSLCHNCGMLFVFENSATYSIWMKNMRFPIDVFWLDENKKVVHVVGNMTPNSFPESFTPPSPAKYIIEVASGTGDQLQVEIGDEIEFDLSN